MQFSKFATRFSSESGIVNLMDDLGSAMTGDKDVLMLGGGNPGHIPEVQQYFHERMQRILDDPAEFAHLIGNYDSPQGETKFIAALAEYLRKETGWDIGSRNIALTAGSQAGFFLLFNMFAGEFEDGQNKKILLPMTPEYIGYSDVGLVDGLFTACRPVIDILDEHTFKYHIDFDNLTITEDIGAICVSRPTNPTGNVLTDNEMQRLSSLASDTNIPLIVDNAYGLPFPNIIFTGVDHIWNENTVLCMSLSKLGLPGARTGIVVAHEEIIRAIANINAVLNLALGSFGPSLALDLVSSGEISHISNRLIKPYYQQKAERAIALFKHALEGVDYYIHKAEGAIFLWLWLPGMPVTAAELYRRLKSRGVLVIPGHYFFPGLNEDWRHKHECIRVTYSMQDEVVEKGVNIIAEEIKKAFCAQET